MYTSVTGLSGVGEMGRSAGQTTFDTEREKLWKQFLSRDGFYQQAATGVLGVEAINQSITEIKQIMDAHTALYNSLRGQVDDSWLAPRYNDFQTVYEGRLQNEMTALAKFAAAPASSGGVNVTGAPTIVLPSDVSQPTQLVISGSAPPTSAAAVPGGSAPVTSGGGWGGDVFGPEMAPGAQAGSGIGNLLPWLAGGLALALLLRKN